MWQPPPSMMNPYFMHPAFIPYPYVYPVYMPPMPPQPPPPQVPQLTKKQLKAEKRKKRRLAKAEGCPRKPATSFVMFSNAHREEVKKANPTLPMIDIARKLGEMWRELDPMIRKEWEDRATSAKDEYLEAKKVWLEQRSSNINGLYKDE
mmetsp:Transcript_17807/g.58579  ORF Transcript_17807/g.58579 Transcript_17807/m.58579 type:complete len:149 (+) Transcript_17807:221-667(+)